MEESKHPCQTPLFAMDLYPRRGAQRRGQVCIDTILSHGGSGAAPLGRRWGRGYSDIFEQPRLRLFFWF